MLTVSSSISSRMERNRRKEDLQHSGLCEGLRFDAVVGSIAQTEISLEGKTLEFVEHHECGEVAEWFSLLELQSS